MLSLNKMNEKMWHNWSESVHCRMEQYLVPHTLGELVSIVHSCKQLGKTIRIVGAGHSFTPLVATSDVMVALHHLKGIDYIDHEKEVVTVWGGTNLKDLGKELYANGYAMQNLGDINAQTIAGAISTGTHGTGIAFGNIPTQIVGLTILCADGNLYKINKEKNAHLFQAARISLGMLGIIVKVDIKVVPSYLLIANSFRLSLDDCIQQIEVLKKENRNFEFYWFPYTKTVQVKTMNVFTGQKQSKQRQNMFKKLVVENGVFWALSEISKRVPKTTKTISTLSALGVPVGSEVNASHLLYATPRLVKFQEMEYSIPEAAIGDVLKEIEQTIKKQKIKVHFPIECRFVQQDDIWLSPSYKRNSAYIALHMYKGMEFNDYFLAMEEIFQKYEGRAHWGKMHTMTYDDLNKVYPKLNDFLHIRQKWDMEGIFMNTYLQDLLQVN